MTEATRIASAKAVLRYDSQRHDLRAALVRHGWAARQQPPTGASREVDVHASGVAVLVVGQGAEADRALREAELRSAQGGQTVVLLLDRESEAHQRWATRLTPYCYPKSLAAESLASLLDRIRESHRAGTRPAEAERRVTLRIGESVEVDGARIRLGVAERNLLWELACRRDRQVSKDAAIESGPGRYVQARECRRRLGRRLGDELASLLVPIERGEPYRLREPEEVEARCLELPERHPVTRLRVIGRAEVGLSFVDDLDRFGAG